MAGERLMRPLFGLNRVQWSDSPDAVEYHLPHGEMISLLRDNGLQVEELIEVQVPGGDDLALPPT